MGMSAGVDDTTSPIIRCQRVRKTENPHMHANIVWHRAIRFSTR